MSRAILYAAALLLWSPLAWALPAPMSEADMLKASDLVVDAACQTIVCDGKPIDDGQKIITKYKSTLWPTKTYKGGLPNSFVIKGQSWKYKGPRPVGGWHQGPVAKGWAGKLYLKKLPDGTYTKIWWNGTIPDKVKSKPLPLPLCTGDGGVPDASVSDKTVPTADTTLPDKLVLWDVQGPEMAMPDDPVGPDFKPTPGKEGPQAEGGTTKDGAVSPDGGGGH